MYRAPPIRRHEQRLKLAAVGAMLALEAHASAGLPAKVSGASHMWLVGDLRAAWRDAGRYLAAGWVLTARREATAAAGRYGDPGAFLAAAEARAVDELAALAEDMADAVGRWLDEGADAPDLAACRERAAGRWVWWLGLMCAWLAGQVNRQTQVAQGVTHARWVDTGDGHVRTPHRRLHGTVFAWDGPPPLRAEDATNGQGCFPGDDYSCRCHAEGITPGR